MSYCLVCLASGTKEPCVQCGHKPSKRVEQLVHLRLKSIYKAFKQSGAALNGQKGEQTSTETTRSGLNGAGGCPETGKSSKLTPGNVEREDQKPKVNSGSTYSWGDCAEASNSSPFPLPETVRKYASLHKKEYTEKASTQSDKFNQNYSSSQVGAAMYTTAETVTSSSTSVNSDIMLSHQEADELFRSKKAFINSNYKESAFPDDFLRHARRGNDTGVAKYSNESKYDERPLNTSKRKGQIGSDQFASKTEAEADAAAAALLAELDEENLRSEATSKAKKNKKKKKKERQQAAKEKEKEELRLRQIEEENRRKALAQNDKEQLHGNKPINDDIEKEPNKKGNEIESETKSKKKKKKKNKSQNQIEASTSSIKINADEDKINTNEVEEKKIIRQPHNSSQKESSETPSPEGCTQDSTQYRGSKVTPLSGDEGKVETESSEEVENESSEELLAKLITAGDLAEIEKLLQVMKGVPGKAALRKNAKKAVKRIKEEQQKSQQSSTENAEATKAPQDDVTEHGAIDLTTKDNKVPEVKSFSGNPSSNPASGTRYKPSEPLLKLISTTYNIQTKSSGGQNVSRSECVMHMAPSVVGWVIGKGGQRIRDLMEESGARVWIDQDSMVPSDMRIVYVSGTRKAIDTAVRMVKDLVAKAPVGGSTLGINQTSAEVQNIPDESSVSSSVSSLTSTTPVSFAQNVYVQHPSVIFDKVNESTLKTNIQAPTAPANITQSHSREHEFCNPLPTIHPTNRHAQNIPPGMSDPSNMNLFGQFSQEGPSSTNPLNGPNVVRELTCEERFVPLLIGRRGWTVKHIQDTSGARVDIDQTVIPRRIIISGSRFQVEEALRLVKGVLSYPHAQLHYSGPGSNMEVENASDASLDQILGNFPPAHTLTNFTTTPEGTYGSDPGQSGQQTNHPRDSLAAEQYQQHSMMVGLPNEATQGSSAQIERQQLHPQLSSEYGIFNNHHQYHTSRNLYGNLDAPPNQLPVRSNVQTEPSLNSSGNNQLNLLSQPSTSDPNLMLYQENRPDQSIHPPHMVPQHNHQQSHVSNHVHSSQIRPAMNSESPLLHTPLFSEKADQSNSEGDIINRLFGAPSQTGQSDVGGSILQGISGMSLESSGFDSGSGGYGLGQSKWNFDSIFTNDDEKPSSKGVGLGGVRLD